MPKEHLNAEACHIPPHPPPPNEVLESVDGDLSVDGVEQGSQQSTHCPHNHKENKMVRLPQLTLTLRRNIYTDSVEPLNNSWHTGMEIINRGVVPFQRQKCIATIYMCVNVHIIKVESLETTSTESL